MRLPKISLAFLVAPFLVLMLAACGSSSNNSSTNVSLRFINASPTTVMTVALSGTVDFQSQAVQSASNYISIASGTYTITTTAAGGTLVSSTLTLGLGAGTTYTLLAYDRDGAIQATLINESQTTPATGFGSLQVATVSQDSGSLDVYVVPPSTTSVSGLAPTYSSIGYGSLPPAQTLAAGSYKVVATAAGNVNDVRFTSPAISVGSTIMQTLAFTGTPGGALVNGVLFTQSANTASFYPATQARVRLFSALPVSPSALVAATIGGTPVPPTGGVFSPVSGAYTLVPGGSTAYSVTVNSTAVGSVPAATFATGNDYTIYVYGTAGSPVVAPPLTDNNQAPNGGNISLRLVNAGVAGGLTMTYGGVQVASAVPLPGASPYFSTTLQSTTVIQLITPGSSPFIPNPEPTITVPQSVWTVFVIDNLASQPIFVRDR